MEAGEPTTAAGIGIDADGVAKVEREVRFLGGVAGDHDLSGHVRLGSAELFVDDGEGELLVEGDVVFQVGVDEDMGVGLYGGFAFSEELPVRFGDVFEASRAIGLEGFGATPDAEPVVAVGEVHLREEEFFLMVPGKKSDVEPAF